MKHDLSASGSLPEARSHLLSLPDPAWALWRQAALRSAGFPAHEALSLAVPACAEQADRYLQAPLDEQKRRSAAWQQTFADGQQETSRAIQQIVRSARFQEALLWQNRQAFATGIAGLVHSSPEDTRHLSQKRQHEILVARYVQRYAMKNDTIGFFGPVGWIWLAADAAPFEIRPGSSVLAERRVYFEQWCISALADTIAQDAAYRPWLVPRRMPHLYLAKTTLRFPFGRALELSALQARVLQACDGQRSAFQVAVQVEDATPAQVYRCLEQLQAAHALTWTLQISPESSFPEQLLRHQLEQIGDAALRAASLRMLSSLETARDAVAAAAGDGEQLAAALEHLDTTFSTLTQAAATRFHGKMYAGRTLVYEDCRRAGEVCLGTDVVQHLGHPLSLLLTSARWFTWELARLYREAFLQAYQELALQMGTATLDFPSFWLWIQPLLFDEDRLLTRTLLPIFQQKWGALLARADAGSAHRVHYTSEELRCAVQASFAAPGPGWRSACYHNPDVLLEARTPEDIRQGSYQLVLGEFHMATNTLQSQLFVLQHPSPHALLTQMQADLPQTRFLPLVGREAFPGSRTRPGLIAPEDIRYVYSSDASAIPGAEVLPISEFVLEQGMQGLTVHSRDGRWSVDLIEFVAEFLSQIASDSFQLRAPESHLPRLTIDRLVVARESWSVDPADLDFLPTSLSQAESFLAARRWMHANALPRFVFFKIPEETKPCFLDFESPLYVEHFRRMARRMLRESQHNARLLLSEMLPAPEHLWLPDAEGRRYTSEIRLVAVDQVQAGVCATEDRP